ncbi:MAG: MoxR family ATPase [Acidobacteria bacterium]|jgi:MoxR-like ATPase|nr:MoxR family ATPase [Acidobacteriota bacterium]
MSLNRVIEIDGVELHLARPVSKIPPWIGQREVLLQLLAAWSLFSDDDAPLNPRLLGKPGVGKTTLACTAARELEREIYILQATTDTRPEDLLVAPVLGPEGGVRYMASPLVTAMVRGGVSILDEGNRMSEKSWASLAPLLDHRRSVDSVVAGITIPAHEDFRFATTMNEDASTYEVPEYIHSRLMPQITIDFPEEDEEREILRVQVAGVDEEVLDYVLGFLRAAHLADLRFSVRDGINIARYAMKILRRREADNAKRAVDIALRLAIGEEEAEPFRLATE